jgi:membrane protein implicated in regulation of membrane protease activity
MDHHDGVDAVGVAHDGGGGIFSIKPLTGFFLAFGWVGGIALDNGLSLFAAIGCALVAGAAVMGVIIAMFRAMLTLKSDGTMDVSKALGAVGTVYVTVPAQKGGGGQVVVNFSGRQETFAALSEAGQPIASGEKVKVVSIIDGRTVLVEVL